MWKSAWALWLLETACSFHVGNVNDLQTDRYYYKKPKSTESMHFLQKSFFMIKIWIYGELLWIIIYGGTWF